MRNFPLKMINLTFERSARQCNLVFSISRDTELVIAYWKESIEPPFSWWSRVNWPGVKVWNHLGARSVPRALPDFIPTNVGAPLQARSKVAQSPRIAVFKRL